MIIDTFIIIIYITFLEWSIDTCVKLLYNINYLPCLNKTMNWRAILESCIYYVPTMLIKFIRNLAKNYKITFFLL